MAENFAARPKRPGRHNANAARIAVTPASERSLRRNSAVRTMTLKEYVLKRLDQGETDLKVLFRQARTQLPHLRVSLNYIRKIRNEWEKTSISEGQASLPTT